eukprot:m.928 g.928  ORF g.928 m.928 type:complete len:57 (+) comp617_c0_seq1:443-613(+)
MHVTQNYIHIILNSLFVRNASIQYSRVIVQFMIITAACADTKFTKIHILLCATSIG